MAIRDRLIDFEQRLRKLAGEGEPQEPLEIRQAVIRQVVDASQPTGRGRRVLPYDVVSVEVIAETAEARRVIEAVLEREAGLESSIRGALQGAGCPPPPSLRVELHYRKKAPAGWPAGRRYAVSGRAVDGGAASPLASATASATAPVEPVGAASGAQGPVTVRLSVARGRAARKVVRVCAERVNLGRGEEVVDRDHRLARRNDVAFVAGDDAGDTVSRAHAHIRCSSSGDCRLRDDGSAHGTRIVRSGRTIEVTPGNTRGVRLQPGDEVHLGRAVVRFAIEAPGADE